MKVSVLLVTYNHERFIEQAVASVLEQRVAFPYELLISEDCSTDSTRARVQAIAAKHPERVRLLLSERNLNTNEVIARGLRAARGQYVALLEGDDYWSSPDKLRRQVEFLDRHPECAICFHAVTVVYEDGRASDRQPRPQPEVTDLEHLLSENFSYTCTTMFRAGLFGECPDWYIRLPMGDYPLHVLNAEHGLIGFIDEPMGTYRVHRGGVWSSMSRPQQLRDELGMYRVLDAHLGFRHHRTIRRRLAQLWFMLALAEENVGNRRGARSALVTSLARQPLGFPVAHWARARLGVRLVAPRFYRWLPSCAERLRHGTVAR